MCCSVDRNKMDRLLKSASVCPGGEQGKEGAASALSRTFSMPVDIAGKEFYSKRVLTVWSAVFRTVLSQY